MNLKTEFAHYHFNCDKFKHKDVALLLNAIKESRLNQDMILNSYGIISFDDESHKYPNIEFEDGVGESSWNKNKTNCIVFDLSQTEKNNIYNKLFLFHTIKDNKSGCYGWIAYNTKTKYMTQKFFIEHDIMSLMTRLNIFFYNIKRADFFNKRLSKAV
jgi:hypothetical protein